MRTSAPSHPTRRQTGRTLLLALAMVSVLVAGACGSDDDTSSADPTTTDPTTPDVEGDPAGTDPDRGDNQADDAHEDAAGALPAAYQGYESDQYAGPTNWLCHPERGAPGDDDENVCHRDLDATLVSADGTVTPRPHERADAPSIDCFYVYPTVSLDPEPNSDLEPGEDEEIWATLNQAARFSEMCEVYAPVYRSRTVTALLQGNTDPEVAETAYGDALDAFKHYMANHNDGRGVLLLGHSQGASVLTRLIAEEIDGEPLLADRLVAAYLLGTSVAVPADADVDPDSTTGGAFENIPLCRTADQVGCVVTYASFSAAEPPLEDSFFGRVRTDDEEDLVAGCTNPAALEDGSGDLRPYFPAADTAETLAPGIDVDTGWIAAEGGLTAECVIDGDFSYLEVTVALDPDGTRSEALRGGLPPNWGLHLADANLAMGNLVDLARTQAGAHTG